MSVDVRLERTDGMHGGGTGAYRVLVAGRWVGWVGDGRPRRGWRYGGRRWWACWREDGDNAARWNTDLDYRSRRTALTALLSYVTSEAA
jgi:hypothetical protein